MVPTTASMVPTTASMAPQGNYNVVAIAVTVPIVIIAIIVTVIILGYVCWKRVSRMGVGILDNNTNMSNF